MNPLLAQFLVEAREQIAATTDGLLGLERAPRSAELLNGVFRSVHTLKGSSGLFDFPALTAVLHAGEDLLVTLRELRLMLEPAMLDQILAALDLVGGWLDRIEDTGALPDDAAERGAPVIAALRAWLGGPQPGVHAEVIVAPPPRLPDWLGLLPEPVLLDAVERTALTGAPIVAVSYRPEPQCFFKGDDPLALVRQVPERLHLEVEAPDAWPPLAECDPFSCTIGFRALSSAPKGEVQHLMRYVASQSEVVEVAAEHLIQFAGPPSGDPAAREVADALVVHHERGDRAALADAASALLESLEDAGDGAMLRWIVRLAPNASVGDRLVGSLVTAFATGSRPVAPEPAPPPVAVAPAASVDLPPAVVTLLREQQEMLRTVRSEAWIGGCIGAAAKVAVNALRYAGRAGEA
ncbi:MAG TPA: Hpt domain-containing protein, partial [Azospirillum sp.]